MLQTVQFFSPHSLLQAKTPAPMPGGMGRRGGNACEKMRLEFLQELTPPPPSTPPHGSTGHTGLAQVDSGILGLHGCAIIGVSNTCPSLPSFCPTQVTLECPGHEEVPRVDKLVEKIVHCSCQACGKEPSHEGLSVYVQGEDGLGSQPGPHPHPHPHSGGQTPEPEEPPGAPQVEEEGAED